VFRAEIQGKLPTEVARAEDLLTSNVIGFFDYGDRSRYLLAWLNDVLHLAVGPAEAKAARITYWPRYDDGTEPDVVIEVGRYYVLIEAKLDSWFGIDPSDPALDQLSRELRQGQAAADEGGLDFRLVTLTRESWGNPERYPTLRDEPCWIWTNWQSVTRLLARLDGAHPDRMCSDLVTLLRRKGLDGFNGFEAGGRAPTASPTIFFDMMTARSAGTFRGWMPVLQGCPSPAPPEHVFRQPRPWFRGGPTIPPPREQLFFRSSRADA